MIPSVLSSQLVQGLKDFLAATYPSSTPAFANMMDEFVTSDGNLFKGVTRKTRKKVPGTNGAYLSFLFVCAEPH